MKNLILLSLLVVVTSSTTISKLEFAQSANAKLTHFLSLFLLYRMIA